MRSNSIRACAVIGLKLSTFPVHISRVTTLTENLNTFLALFFIGADKEIDSTH